MKKKRPTVVDVARIAGVGPSTVSRFLRGVNISKRASDKVERAILQTSYEPDEAARALRVGRSNTLGVVVPKVSNAFFSNAVQILEERSREAGYTVMLLTHGDRLDQQASHLNTLRRCRVEGIILTPAPKTTLSDIQRHVGDVPIVAFDAAISGDLDTVVLENRESARMATEHLIAHGYRHIAAVTAKPSIYSFGERIAGYSMAMESRSLSPKIIAGEDYDELRHLLRKAMQQKHPPDALLTLSDFATLNLIRVFDELSLGPDSWTPFLGFDDFPYATLLPKAVTVIRQPIEEMVRTALHQLLRRLQQPGYTKRAQAIQVPAELVRRRSCGCT